MYVNYVRNLAKLYPVGVTSDITTTGVADDPTTMCADDTMGVTVDTAGVTNDTATDTEIFTAIPTGERVGDLLIYPIYATEDTAAGDITSGDTTADNAGTTGETWVIFDISRENILCQYTSCYSIK